MPVTNHTHVFGPSDPPGKSTPHLPLALYNTLPSVYPFKTRLLSVQLHHFHFRFHVNRAPEIHLAASPSRLQAIKDSSPSLVASHPRYILLRQTGCRYSHFLLVTVPQRSTLQLPTRCCRQVNGDGIGWRGVGKDRKGMKGKRGGME